MLLQEKEINEPGESISSEEEKIMIEAGVHFGHRTSKLHPRMKPFLVGIRNTVHVIDLKKTQECLQSALFFISNLISEGGTLTIVSTKPPLKNLIAQIATDCGLSYVNERWLGGTFTNFSVIAKRIKYFKDQKADKEKGNFDKYTKKEKISLEKELKSMEVKFGGLRNLEKVPEAVFICDLVKDTLCLKEALAKGVKVVAIADTNADPLPVDYPIPANDDAIPAVKYILDQVRNTVLEARKKVVNNQRSSSQ